MKKNILLLPGDGVGQEIIQQVEKILVHLIDKQQLPIEYEYAHIGGVAYEQYGTPCPQSTLEKAMKADAVLLGAVGGYQWDDLPKAKRPETGLLTLRKQMNVFCNLRPVYLFPALTNSSTLKPEVIKGLDILFVRELISGIYFGEPRGIEEKNGEKVGFNTLRYTESEITAIAHKAFLIAQQRPQKKLCSVDKANVLEVMQLWRNVVNKVALQYPDVRLTHMYVDNAAMQLVSNPSQFDVLLTGNMFGDILSDCGAMLSGSIGMLPSACLGKNKRGLYEPIHGSAPDISGTNSVNPIAAILSFAMMLRYSLDEKKIANTLHNAVEYVLSSGNRTKDIFNHSENLTLCSTGEMGDKILDHLKTI